MMIGLLVVAALAAAPSAKSKTPPVAEGPSAKKKVPAESSAKKKVPVAESPVAEGPPAPAKGAEDPPVDALPPDWRSDRLALEHGPSGLACTATHAYVRGWSGDVVMWDGARWTSLPRAPAESNGRSIAATSDGHVFLESAHQAQIVEWDGARWIVHPLARWDGDEDAQFAAPSASEVYFVGRGRVARRWGSGFGTFSAGTWRSLSAVAVVGDEVWVGGQGGTVMRYVAGTWSRLETGTEQWIRRLVVVRPDDVWALADGESYGTSQVLRWDGRAWTRREEGLPPGEPIVALAGAGETVYALAEQALLRWSGAAWMTELALPGRSRESRRARQVIRDLEAVCATDRHVIVVERRGEVLSRPR